MPKTPRMLFPYPREHEEPFYDSFVAFVEALDASGFASREDRHITLMGGGLVSLSEEGELSWAQDIELLAAITGFLWRVPAGSIQMVEGGLLYVDLVRAPTLNVVVPINVGSQVPSTDSTLLLGAMRGGRLYFRNGQSIALGESRNIFEGEADFGSVGQIIRNTVTVSANKIITQDSIFTSLGMISLDPSEFSFSRTTLKITFNTIASVLDLADILTIQLYNLTDDVEVVSHPVDTIGPTEHSSEVTLVEGHKIYEIRAKLDEPKTDDGVVSFAGIHIDLVRS